MFSDYQSALRFWIDLLSHKGSNIHIAHSDEPYTLSAGKHYHLYPEIHLQIKGNCKFFFDKSNKVNLKEGEILIIPEGIPHFEKGKQGKEPFCNFVVMQSQDTLQTHFGYLSTSSQHPRMRDAKTFNADQNTLLNNILAIVSNNLKSKHINHKAANLLLASWCQTILESKPLSKNRKARLKKSKLVKECITYVEQYYYDSECTVSKIAQLLNCTPNHLSAMFTKHNNISLNNYIKEKRMNLAKKLLSSNKFNVSQTAGACGYEDNSYFVKQFRVATGITPKKYALQSKNMTIS